MSESLTFIEDPRGLRRPVVVMAFSGWNDAAESATTATRYLGQIWPSRPFARIDGIQGRAQDALRLPSTSGGHVLVQPVVIHRAMDMVQASGWQIVHEDGRLTILLAGLAESFDADAMVIKLRENLARVNAVMPDTHVERVPFIPRTALGKAPLIRSVSASQSLTFFRAALDLA